MSRSSSTYLRLLVLLAALLLCIGPVLSLPSPNAGKEDDRDSDKDDYKKNYRHFVRVKRGESIQSAIDHAKPYTRIEVEGDHYEQVTINKDGISLVGKGAKLYPPQSYDTHNFCYGLIKDATNTNRSAGICIHGKVKLFAEYIPFFLHWKVEKVYDPVKDVSVSDFEVNGFDGPNIAVYGGKNTKIYKNKLKRGLRYGFLTVGSTGTEASNNIVIGSAPSTLLDGPIAMCMDDFSSATFSKNKLSNYFIGLCTETSGGVNQNNNIRDCCIGNIIDPNVTNAKSLDNNIKKWNPGCDVASAAGISLLGAKNALVSGNYISIGIDPPEEGAGLFLGFDEAFNAVNEGNTITKNKFGKNPADIFNDAKGRNHIFDNKCDRPIRGPLPGTVAPEYCSGDYKGSDDKDYDDKDYDDKDNDDKDHHD